LLLAKEEVELVDAVDHSVVMYFVARDLCQCGEDVHHVNNLVAFLAGRNLIGPADNARRA
jgi:hypothetical protein